MLEGNLTPVHIPSPDSCSHPPSPSVSASHTSPSIPAEGDWLEASDLDGERWVQAEDMDALWGQDNPIALMSNATSIGYPGQVAQAAAPVQPDAADEPLPKRPRLSTSPIRIKASAGIPSVAAHHAMISVVHPTGTIATSHSAGKHQPLLADPSAPVDGEDDTGSSGDVSASLRPMHTVLQQSASSHHSAGTVSDEDADDPDFAEATQASSQGADSDDGSESSDGFEGMPSRYCINCMSRMLVGEVLCEVMLFAYCLAPEQTPVVSVQLVQCLKFPYLLAWCSCHHSNSSVP